MPSQASVLDIDDMKEAVADWAEKTTGKRPDLKDVAYAGWGGGQWFFETSSWRASSAPAKDESCEHCGLPDASRNPYCFCLTEPTQQRTKP
jgi:hypothetical protein